MWKIFKTIEGSSHSNGGEDMVLNGLPVEVEGGELLLQHSNGSVGVVPKRHASYVKNLASTKSPFLDQYMDSLQKMGTYANNGTIVPLYASEQVLDSNDDDKKAIAKHAPGLKGRYGDDMRYLDVYRDKNYKAHEYGYGSIEYMQPWQNSVRYEDKYSYPNHNYGSGKDMIVYNPDKSDIGDVILDASSHGFRDDPRHTELAKTIISESSNDIDHFYKLSGMKDSRGDFEMNWVDGKIRSYMAQNGDVPVRESVKKDYANEYFTDTEKIAVEKYYNDVIRKDPSVVNTIARQRVKLSDGGIIGDPPKLEDGGIIDGGRQLVKRKPTPTRKPNIDSLYNYSDTEKAFLEKQYPYAKAVGDKYDIDPVLLLTHTGTETTFNNNKYLNNNIFGLKAPKDTAGQPIGNYKYEKTGEWMSDDKQDYRFKTVHSKTYNEKRKEWYYEVDEPFVTYDSMEDAYESLLNNMSKSSRYAPVLAKKDDANAYFDALGKSGFSTSKTYGETLKSNYDKTRAYVQYRIENKPKLEDGAVIGDPLKGIRKMTGMFGYEYMSPKKESPIFKEPGMANDNVPKQSTPTYLQQGVADVNIMPDKDFETKYKVHKHGWSLMNSPEYAAEVEAGIDKNNPNTIDYQKTSFLNRTYEGNPNLAYTRTNQSGTDMIKGMEQAHMNVVGAVLPIPFLDAPIMGKSIMGSILKASKGFKGANTAAKEIGVVDDIAKVSKQPWQMQEMPGLHLQSTMENGAISKIVEPKTGLVNVEQALGIIGKESGGADKVALIKQGLGENIPKKMDFNEFRKITQEQLIPLEKQFSELRSDYGINSIGYGDITDIIKKSNGTYDIPVQPIENQTLILGNKGKFGRGSSAHGNPEETLGHAHFLRDAETPDVLTVTQIQSDAFQGTHRIMPKKFDEIAEKRSLRFLEEQAINQGNLHKQAVKQKDGSWLYPDGTKISDKIHNEFSPKAYNDLIAQKKVEIENFAQKQLLDKNHQERYLQELVDYAGKRGDVNKVRVPTSETAAKVQGYSKTQPNPKNREILDEITALENNRYSELPDELINGNNIRYSNTERTAKIESLRSKLNNDLLYSTEHQTILKKYSEQPKTIKKLFGIEPKVVTDSKGNTWYEFDIPKKFKEGKGEIKAFSTIPAIGTAGAIGSTTNNNKQNGKNNK